MKCESVKLTMESPHPFIVHPSSFTLNPSPFVLAPYSSESASVTALAESPCPTSE